MFYPWKTLIEPHYKADQFTELSDARDDVFGRFKVAGKAVPNDRYVEKWISRTIRNGSSEEAGLFLRPNSTGNRAN